jgi:hypothetical protein
MIRWTLKLLTIFFLLLGLKSNGQTFDEPNKELIRKFKIKTVTSWLCDDSICKSKKHFMSWNYGKNGNLLTEFLGKKSDTSFLNKYYYDSKNRLIKQDEIGNFLCYKDTERNKRSVITNYIYNNLNQIIEENKIGGCCNLTTKYYYDSNQLRKIIFLNTGCKYHGECDTTLFEYYVNDKLLSETNKSDDKYITYNYNKQGQLIEKIYKSFFDTTRIYIATNYFYNNNRVSIETDDETSYGFEGKTKSHRRQYNYYYDGKGLLIKIDEIQNDKIEHRYIYTY